MSLMSREAAYRLAVWAVLGVALSLTLSAARIAAAAGPADGLGAADRAPTFLAQAAPARAPAPGVAAKAQADLEALIKAAKAEGEFTYYYTMAENIAKRTNDAFTARYGVKTQSLRVVLLQQRYAAEMASNATGADVVFQSSTLLQFAEDGIKKGWMESINDAALPEVTSGRFPARFNRGAAAVVQVSPWVLGYDTNKVKGGDIPKDWPDILHPRFKGQILLADTASSFAYYDFWAVMYDRYGEAFFTGLRAQTPRVYSSGTPASQGLGAGEGMLQVPTVASLIRVIRDKGAPVDTVMLPYTTGVEQQVALTARARAKRPAAARLFVNFIMSPEGNRVFSDEPGSISVYDDSGLPREYVAPSFANQARAAQIRKLLGQQ